MLLPSSYRERPPIPGREDQADHLWVFSKAAVEHPQRFGSLTCVPCIDNITMSECVVPRDDTARLKILKRPFQIRRAALFFGIDEYKIKWTFCAQFGQQLMGVTHANIHALSKPCKSKIVSRDLGMFRI